MKTAIRPKDSETIEMLRLLILKTPGFTALVIPKGLLVEVPKKIHTMDIIESDLAEAGRIYFTNTGILK